MLIALRNAPDTFQHTMDVILFAVKLKFTLVYSDDTLIFSKPPMEHIAPVHKVSLLLDNAGVALKLKKRRFFTETIE